jgi:hypothetical protein
MIPVNLMISSKRLCGLAAAVGIALALSEPSAAAEISAAGIGLVTNGSEITLRIASATRREALERIIGEDPIAIEWLRESVADEPIKGEYRGTLEKVITALLDRSNFIIRYDSDGQQVRISRITVIGPISEARADAQTGQADQTIRPKSRKAGRVTSASERRKKS